MKKILICLLAAMLLLVGCSNQKASNVYNWNTSSLTSQSSDTYSFDFAYSFNYIDQNGDKVNKNVDTIQSGEYELSYQNNSSFDVNETFFILFNSELLPFVPDNGTKVLYYNIIVPKNSKRTFKISFSQNFIDANQGNSINFCDHFLFIGAEKISSVASNCEHTNTSNHIIKTKGAKVKISEFKKYNYGSFTKYYVNNEGIYAMDNPDQNLAYGLFFNHDNSNDFYLAGLGNQYYGNVRVLCLIDNKFVKAFNGSYYADFVQTKGKNIELMLDKSVLPTSGDHTIQAISLVTDSPLPSNVNYMMPYSTLFYTIK